MTSLKRAARIACCPGGRRRCRRAHGFSSGVLARNALLRFSRHPGSSPRAPLSASSLYLYSPMSVVRIICPPVPSDRIKPPSSPAGRFTQILSVGIGGSALGPLKHFEVYIYRLPRLFLLISGKKTSIYVLHRLKKKTVLVFPELKCGLEGIQIKKGNHTMPKLPKLCNLSFNHFAGSIPSFPVTALLMSIFDWKTTPLLEIWEGSTDAMANPNYVGII
ncbi:hypothetical protein Sjap_017707 [Stephania japonica]|uniref:Uncharacterized protein n=1 Tax=Stephania japonica TaxID=461633 RepID=A0AAP0I6P5_9MAGN